MIGDGSVGDNGAVTSTPGLTYSGCVHFLRMGVYIIYALLLLAGVTSVKFRQTLDKLWTLYRVDRIAA